MNSSTQRGERIKTERQRLGLSQQKSADAVGIRREMWAKYEAGAEPGAEPLAGMRKIGVDVDFVLTGKTLHQRAADAVAQLPKALHVFRAKRSAETLAKRLGISAGEWLELESGKRPFTSDLVQRLITAFPEMNVAKLLTGEARAITTDNTDEVILIDNYRACSMPDRESIRHHAAFLASRSGSSLLTPSGQYTTEDPTTRTVHETRKKTL